MNITGWKCLDTEQPTPSQSVAIVTVDDNTPVACTALFSAGVWTFQLADMSIVVADDVEMWSGVA